MHYSSLFTISFFCVSPLVASTPLQQLHVIRATVISNSIAWNMNQETLQKTHPIMNINTNVIGIIYELKIRIVC